MPRYWEHHYQPKKQYSWTNFKRGVIKLSLNLVILAGFGGLIGYGYLLFTHKVEFTPAIGSFLLLLGIAIWVTLIIFLRHRYRRTKPSFKLTTFSVIAILLVFIFAGVQPMASYKDGLINTYRTAQAERAAKEAAEEEERVAEAIAMTPMLIQEAPSKIENEVGSGTTVTQTLKVEEAEREAFELINAVREKAGVPPTKWNDELYGLSKKHTQEMADRGELFHTPIGAEHGENAWGGMGYGHYSYQELAKAIVGSWMSSPLHQAWLLHAPIRESVVSIVSTPDGQYASWSFWTAQVGEGPALVVEVSNRWMKETGGEVPWITWLKINGYLE